MSDQPERRKGERREYRDEDEANPKHYRKNGIECIDALPERFRKVIRETIDPEGELVITKAQEDFHIKLMMIGFCSGNAYKYGWRAGNKEGEPLEKDMLKAEWYDRFAAHLIDPHGNPDPRDKKIA